MTRYEKYSTINEARECILQLAYLLSKEDVNVYTGAILDKLDMFQKEFEI